MFLENILHDRHHALIFALSLAGFPVSPGVISGATCPECAAQCIDGKLVFESTDDGVKIVYVFWLKMAKAFFKISRSLSVRRKSFSSCATRASSSTNHN
jgi:hypothetical protein